jgi:uncharacterized protein (TIGR02284 family)
MAQNDKTIDILQDLLQRCRDGQHGYKEAAEHIQDPSIKSFFNEQSIQRAQFASELEREIKQLGKSDVDRSSTIEGAIHRGIIDLKGAITKGDKAILSEVERGEDFAKKDYEDALNQPLPSNLMSVIRSQAQSIFSAHDYVKSLRDSKERAA